MQLYPGTDKRDFLFEFHCQPEPSFDTFHEPGSLMISAQPADRVYDPVDLLQRHPVHLLVQLMEISLDLFVVVRVMFIVALV